MWFQTNKPRSPELPERTLAAELMRPQSGQSLVATSMTLAAAIPARFLAALGRSMLPENGVLSVSRADKRAMLLKSRIELACSEASNWIDDMAAKIKQTDGQNQPLGVIRNVLVKGEHVCDAALRLIQNGE
jgi:hypothetical protein